MNLAYIAGFVDGEGSIGFGRARTSTYPKVLVTNTNREILEELQKQFGGNIQPLSKRKDRWKQGWYWRITWSRAVDFLDAIQPWLRLKTQQAAAIFAWDTVRPGKGRKQDEETMNYLVAYIHKLNRKGI